MILRDMCPDCQHPYSVHGHGGEGENAYPVCPPEISDEMAEVIESAVDEDLPADPTRAELQAACMRAADAILPIIEREITRARAEERDKVLALHYKADDTAGREPVCPECEGRAGEHPCGCWSSEDRVAVCGHCREGWKGASVPYPCPTARALGVTEEGER